MSRHPVAAFVATRRLAPDDAEAVAAMVRRCTNKSLYLRLLGGIDAVRAIADPIKHGKPCGRVDIGAFTGACLVGVASLVPTRNAWEVAILVEDAWQGNRIGSQLADNLVQHAIGLRIATMRVHHGGLNRKAASLVTSRARDLVGPSVSSGVIERYVAPTRVLRS